ncbi:hypothetical protein HDU67_000955 [Dinochytrium kinnereticum]|nr:hypothetical protein HDU67_000955 [Dinochytrium kinnereticum]
MQPTRSSAFRLCMNRTNWFDAVFSFAFDIDWLQGIAELEDLQAIIRERLITEENYANRLQVISKSKPKTGEDSTTLLSQIFSSVRRETAHIAESHRNMALNLGRLLRALQVFMDENRKLSAMKKEGIENGAKRLERYRVDVDTAKRDSVTRWNVALAEEKKHDQELATSGNANQQEEVLEPMDVMMVVGEQGFTAHEFNNFLTKMQQEIPSQDVRSILGTYKSCIQSEDIINYVKARLRVEGHGALLFCNDLVSQSFLKPVGRYTKFLPGQQYQWRRLAVENEPPHKKAFREAEQMEHSYRILVKAAESARGSLESDCTEFMKAVESAQRQRLSLAKEVLSSYITFERAVLPATTASCDRIEIFLETLSPEREVQVMAERDRTGNSRLHPVIYCPQYPPHLFPVKGANKASNGLPLSAQRPLTPNFQAACEQAFGVPLEDSANAGGRRVPPLIRKAVRALVKSNHVGGHTLEEEFGMWLEPNTNLYATQALRSELNYCKGITLSMIRKHPVTIIIGMIKLWLLQLPVSVCSYEIYEPLKLLYLSKSEEFTSARIGSLKSLLATLPPAHYHTLSLLSGHWHKYVSLSRAPSGFFGWSRVIESVDKEDHRITEFCQLTGPMILRPRIESQVTAHDKHPSRLIRDILTSHLDLFTATTPTTPRRTPPTTTTSTTTTTTSLDPTPRRPQPRPSSTSLHLVTPGSSTLAAGASEEVDDDDDDDDHDDGEGDLDTEEEEELEAFMRSTASPEAVVDSLVGGKPSGASSPGGLRALGGVPLDASSLLGLGEGVGVAAPGGGGVVVGRGSASASSLALNGGGGNGASSPAAAAAAAGSGGGGGVGSPGGARGKVDVGGIVTEGLLTAPVTSLRDTVSPRALADLDALDEDVDALLAASSTTKDFVIEKLM